MLKQKLKASVLFFAPLAMLSAAGVMPAYAGLNVATLTVDGGPLGPLSIDGGLDVYAYAMTGTGAHSAVGRKSTGVESFNTYLDVYKPSGLLRFFVRFLPNNSYAIGLAPSAPSITNLELGPIKAAYLTLVPNTHLKFSAGYLFSAEGFESSVDVYNPNILESAAYWVENSSGPGVNATYSEGPASVTVQFGDGWQTGSWNVVQGYASYTFNANNTLNLYGAGNINKIPLTAKTDGYTGCPYGTCTVAAYGSNEINSTMFGAYYSFTSGNLSLTPQVQYAYAKADKSLGIPKFTSSLAVILHTDYTINKNWSVGGFVQGFSSNGDQYWYITNNAAGMNVAVTPTWQQGVVFVRGTVGLTQLTNKSAYGADGQGKTQVSAVLETGLIF